MIQKVQTLQKRLIAKTEEVVEADLLIQEKEKLYVELKNILARQPGPEVAEQLSIYQVLCSSSCVLPLHLTVPQLLIVPLQAILPLRVPWHCHEHGNVFCFLRPMP